MGFSQGSASFTRLKITEEVPSPLWSEITSRLKAFSFIDIDNLPDERSFGWVNIDDMLDPAWRESPPEKAHYITFSLRLDTRRISPAVLKKHRTLALRDEEERQKADGRPFVAKVRKKELFEAVRARLLARSLPIPAEFNVIWNMQTNIVFFASTQAKMVQMFIELFAKTFELDIEPLTPYAMATHLKGEEISTTLDGLAPLPFA